MKRFFPKDCPRATTAFREQSFCEICYEVFDEVDCACFTRDDHRWACKGCVEEECHKRMCEWDFDK